MHSLALHLQAPSPQLSHLCQASLPVLLKAQSQSLQLAHQWPLEASPLAVLPLKAKSSNLELVQQQLLANPQVLAQELHRAQSRSPELALQQPEVSLLVVLPDKAQLQSLELT